MTVPNLARADIIIHSASSFRLTDPPTERGHCRFIPLSRVSPSINTPPPNFWSQSEKEIMSNLSSQLRYDGKVVIVTGAGGKIVPFDRFCNMCQVVLERSMPLSLLLVEQVLL